MFDPTSLIPNKLLLWGLAAAVALFAVKLVHDEYTGAIAQAATAEQQVARKQEVIDQQELSIEKLREAMLLSDTLNKQAKQEAEHERKRRTEFEAELREAMRADPTVAAWFDAPVPPVVRSVRRANRAVHSGGTVQRPDGTPRADPGAGTPRQDERGPAPGDRRAGRMAGGAALLQP